MEDIKPGDKVQYLYLGKWQKGVLHGVKTHETSDGIVTAASYLIDTGNDERVDEVVFDQRDRELDKQINAYMTNHDSTHAEAVEAVLERDKLPKSKLVVEQVRHPEQIEVAPEQVKAL